MTIEGADRLRTRRALLLVNLDAPETPIAEADASEGGAQDNAIEFPPSTLQIPTLGMASGSTSRSTSVKSRLGFLSWRNFAYALRRLGSRSSSRNDQILCKGCGNQSMESTKSDFDPFSLFWKVHIVLYVCCCHS